MEPGAYAIVGDINTDTWKQVVVDNVITHPSKYFALVMLTSPLEWTDDVIPACLPQEPPLAGLNCTKNHVEREYSLMTSSPPAYYRKLF